MEKNGNRKLTERKGKNGVKSRTGICLLLTVCVCLVGFPTETGKPVGKETAGWTRAAEAEGAEAVEMEEWPAVANEDGTGENTPEDVSGSDGEQGGTGESSGSGEDQGSSGEGSGSGEGQGSSGEGSGSGGEQGSSGEGSGSGGEQGSSGEGSGSGGGQGSSGEGSGSGEGQGSSGEGSGSGGEQGSSGEGSGSGEGQGSSGEGSGSGEGQGSSGEGSGSGEGQGSSGEGSGSGEGQSGTGEGSGSGEGQGSSGEGSGSGTGEGQGDPEPSADPTETVEATPTPTPSPQPEETEDPSVFVMEGDVLKEYKGKKTEVKIPEGVRVIDFRAFERNKTIEKVFLPDSVEEIGEEAFANCSNLLKVTLPDNSKLHSLGARAFANCTNLDISFAEGIEQEENTFDGVKPTPTPEPVPVVTTDALPTPAPTSTPTPEGEGEGEDDFYDDIEWEIPSTSTRTTSSGQRKPRHTRNRTKFTHDYDQVVIGAGETEPMQELTLGGEVLELSLKGMNGGPAAFTAAFAVGEKIWDGSAEDAKLVDTLVLKATSETGNRWTMNGNVLRQLYKTGIDYLVFRDARADVILPTEGFLAGRVYDEMKSRGVGGRKFDYTLETGDSLKWAVTVEGEAFGLDENPAAPIYLTGVTVVSKNPGSGSSARMDSGDGSRE